MNEQQPAAQPVIAVSPYLSLRQAVRPLIFAHALLAREQERAGQLAEECRRLVHLTRELLEAAALVHLLAPGRNEADDNPSDSQHSELVAAYSKAGLMWAEVTGSTLALADTLLDNGKWEDVYRLAGFLAAAGEQSAAQDLCSRADAAAKRANEARLAQIIPTMRVPEIAAAIEAMRECKDKAAASRYIHILESAILGAAPQSWQHKSFDCEYSGTLRFKWRAKVGDGLTKGRLACTYESYSPGVPWYSGFELKMPFSAIITELLVADGIAVKGPTALASVIEVPHDIAQVLEATANGGVFQRLEAYDYVFRRIQAENARTPAVSA